MQCVARQGGSSSDDFHSYQGRLEAGHLEAGDEIKALSGGYTARVAETYNPNGKIESAEADEVLTVALGTDLDISCNNNTAAAGSLVTPEQQFRVALRWLGDIPFNLRRKYLLRHTTQTTPVKISAISHVWDVNTLSRVESVDTLELNGVGSVSLKIQQPTAAASYEENHALGAFTLIDEATNHTVIVGVIRGSSQPNSFEIWVRHPIAGRLRSVFRWPVTL